MKSVILLILVHLSYVLSGRDSNSQPLLFKSHTDGLVSSFRQDRDSVIKKSQRKLKDIGYATNCGNPAHNFTLSWKPKVVDPSRGAVFNLNMIAASNFISGTVKLSVYTGGSKEPFFSDTLPLTCSAIHERFPHVKCPIDKGDSIKLDYVVPQLTALPPGSYKLKADIKDKDDKDFLCALVQMEIK